ncbi:C40 family peptidase [Christensenella hongkongensis]|uniref:C40 family peptidase n=1 Tax=Christensenella hongkongensis TaxID=270498 RepID=UPI002671BBD3|nr:C40 family peptidase [Christensenella hongkongensis]
MTRRKGTVFFIALLIVVVLAAGRAYAYDLPLTLAEAQEQQKKPKTVGTVLCDTVLYSVPEQDAETVEEVGIGEELEVYAVNVNGGFDAVRLEDGTMAYIRSDEISMTAPTYARDDRPESHITDGGENGYPGEVYNNESYLKLMAEAKKYIGMPYVWGGSTPETSFDCSGYVCWVFNQTGLYDLGRANAQGIYNECEKITREEAKPGDLIFFQGTYEASWPVTHVAIYVGNNYMLHCGKPIGYSRVDTPYWTEHFYGFGRLKIYG